MTKVTVHQAKTQLSRLIARALAGEDVVIHRGNEPVVRLAVVRRIESKRAFGAMKGKVNTTPAFFEPLPDEELNAWDGR